MRSVNLIFAGLFMLFTFGHSNAQETKSKFTGETRKYVTQRLETERPKIDGILNDVCWNQGAWAGEFRQNMPVEGGKPTMPTKMKILYNDGNIYVAFMCYDEPGKIDRLLARRDQFAGDIVGVNFDSYHDRRTGFEFNLTAAGSKIDLVLTNEWAEGNMDGLETDWNPVWEGKVGVVDSGWVAEMRIPLSQLRYSSEPVQVWGLHAWRWINRNAEEDQWNLIPRDHSGALYNFGELHGIENLPPVSRNEFMPYTVAKLETYEAESGNPFLDGSDASIAFGLDGKLGLGSNFTMDYTINPDFGQVEADPSELNLTAFETYYEEKRPFFIEGRNIFGFGFDDNQLLYSRRIGHSPTYDPDLNNDEYKKIPENTSILGAVKLSGKTANGVSIGILESLTSAEYARISSPGEDYRMVAEPLTNYFAGRVQKDINNSNTIVGGMITSTNRNIDESYLDFMGKSAVTGGIDFKHFIQKRTFNIIFKMMGSQINGNSHAISSLQKESSRYYQRPDAPHLKVDSTASILRGTGGTFEFNKDANGKWRYGIGVHWISPGLELNDIGFQSIADRITQGQKAAYVENSPKWIFRKYEVGIGQINVWNFGGEYLASDFELESSFTFKNKWSLHLNIEREGKELNVSLLRGGPGIYTYGGFGQNYFLMSDPSKKVSFGMGYENEISDDKISNNHEFHTQLTWRVTNSLNISPQISYHKSLENFQYISNGNLESEGKFLLGKLDRKTYSFTFRVSYALTPELSLQYYGSPYFSMGTYSDFKSLADEASIRPGGVFHTFDDTEFSYDLAYRTYRINSEGITFANPDFNFRELRSNLVARWEYRPGSVFYLVWTHNRTSRENITNHSLNYNINQLFNQYPSNVFLVKFNYWFSL